VLEDGRVAEAGTHAQLLARGGLFTRFHRLQFGEAVVIPSGGSR
jgi:subfamily B ATP-binding cassette protein MsbA